MTRNTVKDNTLKRKQTTFLCICPDKNTDFEYKVCPESNETDSRKFA